jgi:alpha-ribazole phosphatase
MSDWYWIRHGPTHAKGMVGWTDLPADLSDTKTLAALDKYLPDDALVVSSDLQRTIKTADALQQKRNRLDHEPDLREIHFGDWEERNWREISSSHPQLSEQFWTVPGDIQAPGGESWNQSADRVSRKVDQLAVVHWAQPVIAVAHFGVILTQVQRAAKISATSALAYKIDNFSLTHLKVEGGVWRVVEINRIL